MNSLNKRINLNKYQWEIETATFELEQVFCSCMWNSQTNKLDCDRVKKGESCPNADKDWDELTKTSPAYLIVSDENGKKYKAPLGVWEEIK